MTDTAIAPARVTQWDSAEHKRRVRGRHAADKRLQAYGLAAITASVLLLGIFIGSLIISGLPAFTQTMVQLPVKLDPATFKPDDLASANYRTAANNAIDALAPQGLNRTQRNQFRDIVSSEARFILRDYVLSHPQAVGTTITLTVPLSDPFDQLYKGIIPREVPALSTPEIQSFRENVAERGVIDLTGPVPAVKLDIHIDPAKVPADNPAAGNYGELAHQAFDALVPGNAPQGVLADNAAGVLKDYVTANPSVIGQTLPKFSLPLSPLYGELAKGEMPMKYNQRFASAEQIKQFDGLVEKGLLSSPINWALVTNPDSRFPEIAGLSGAIVGSFYALLVCFLISFPVGIAAAVYLEEFAPKNRWTDLIEVNINNLAAVPSIVFGLLGLALFLNTFGLPRSAPLVGGMVLALMTLPTIIVATRAALKAVPPSIREAALGVGASNYQVVLHHVLPLAMPGILTGAIIGLAQALGETAPLLLIGMNAFISSGPGGILDPATSLPTQIFSWADSPERGFVSRTSAAILVLLGFLVIMNLVAIFLRQRFERKW